MLDCNTLNKVCLEFVFLFYGLCGLYINLIDDGRYSLVCMYDYNTWFMDKSKFLCFNVDYKDHMLMLRWLQTILIMSLCIYECHIWNLDLMQLDVLTSGPNRSYINVVSISKEFKLGIYGRWSWNIFWAQRLCLIVENLTFSFM